MKPNTNSGEVHPGLSNKGGHPVVGVLVSVGPLWPSGLDLPICLFFLEEYQEIESNPPLVFSG